jgi:hypothetical protein
MRSIASILLCAVIANSCVGAARPVNDKISVEHLVVMHLEAIGRFTFDYPIDAKEFVTDN